MQRLDRLLNKVSFGRPTMRALNQASRKIADIIGVIDGIAFQTTILALNAAVASEVRNLAQRSAAAAKDIKLLIDDSVATVEEGSGQVDRAGVTMKEIVRSIGQVSTIVNEIADASKEQRAGIGQVNGAIVEMDRVTQQNAALVGTFRLEREPQGLRAQPGRAQPA